MTERQVALYARVSSEQPAEAKTIESQLDEIRAQIATDGIDLTSVLEFVDNGYSGSTSHAMRNELPNPQEARIRFRLSLRRKNQLPSFKEAPMSSIADGTVCIQPSSQSLAAPPSWFGEVVLL